MTRTIKVPILITLAFLLQVTLLPAYIEDPFQPSLLIIGVVYLGLCGEVRFGGMLVFLLGLFQDCFSGLYLGLSGFSSLVIYILLRTIADRLYSDSRYLLIMMVFLSTIVNGLLQLLLLLLFSAGNGVYVTLLPSLLPQALVNALVTSLLFRVASLSSQEEKK